MNMKPILFNTEMVRAILDNRKTVTRRVVKPQPADTDDCQHEMQTYDQMIPQFYKGDYSCVCRKCGYGTDPSGESIFQPPYHPGQTLYVRETWQYMGCVSDNSRIADKYVYRADWGGAQPLAWRPSIHMPREAARIFLRVKDVRVERLQDITEEQAKAEGARKVPWVFEVDDMDGKIKNGPMQTAIQNFAGIWDSTIKPKDRALYGWEANPYVWVIEFEQISREEAMK